MAHVALAYPPIAGPYAPYLSVPELATNLRQAGHRVTPFDFNLEAHDFLLTRHELERAFIPVVERFERLEHRDRLLTPEEHEEYAQLAGPVARWEYLCDQIDRVVTELHDSRFYTFDENGESRQTLNWSIFTQTRLVLFTSHALNRFLYEGADGGISCFMSAEHILAAINAEMEAPIHRYYLERAIPRLKVSHPDLVGISWTFPEQTVPTFLLAALIKRHLPDIRVVLGGNVASLLHRELARALPLHQYIDGFVVGDGEPALREMALQLDAGRWAPADVPNFHYFVNGSVRQSRSMQKWRIHDDPPPDFDGLSLDRYYVGTRQLAYMTARGCYYNKCRFCNFPTTKSGYQLRSAEKVAADLDTLATRYNTRLFYIADDAVAPTRTFKIAVEILKRQLDITWWVLTRYDKGWTPERLRIIKAAGCYRLFFGGESADDRLQAYSGKGFGRSRIRNVLGIVRESGLHAHMSTIVGFPTETEQETENTIMMVQGEMRGSRFSGRVHIFRLTAYSEFATEPGYGVHPLFHPLNELAVNYAYYRVNGGTVRQMLSAKEKARTRIDAFNRDEQHLKLHCYPETHSYEGLQFFANYNGEIPATPVEAQSYNKQRLIRMAPWTTIYQFQHPVDAIADWYRTFQRESELVAFEQGIPLNEAQRRVLEEQFSPFVPDPVVALINHMTGDRRYLAPRAKDLLALCDGTRTAKQVFVAYINLHPEDAEGCPSPSEALLLDLVENGFLRRADHGGPKRLE